MDDKMMGDGNLLDCTEISKNQLPMASRLPERRSVAWGALTINLFSGRERKYHENSGGVGGIPLDQGTIINYI